MGTSLRGGLRRLRHGAPIVVVSGLPRSGTSMMMRMLDAGGIALVTDAARAADDSNPYGYFELDAVKSLDGGGDTAWLAGARGKAVKIVSFLLSWLPETYDYRVIFMRRDLRDVAASQAVMLAQPSRGLPAVAASEASDQRRLEPRNREPTIELYARHLEELDRLMAARPCFTTLDVDYHRVLSHPRLEAERIARFLGRDLDLDAMAHAIDPALNHHGQDATAR